METRTTKVFLPQNYQEYLAQKKKINRLIISKSNINPADTSIHTRQPNEGTSRTIKSQNFMQGYNHLNRFQSMKQKIDSDKQDQQNRQQPKKQVKIVQRIVYSEYKNLFNEFQSNKFQFLKKKLQQQLQKLKQVTPLAPLKVNEVLKKIELQSLQNVKEIQKEMQHPFSRRNAEKLDEMLNFNKFFVILNKEKRYKIYQNSNLLKFQPGTIVYNEGQPNEYMYVIIKGCVKQYEIKSTSYQEKVQVNFASYYEGSNFGQAPLVSDPDLKGKRFNTTQTTEQSYLLQLTNSFYKQLITNSAEDDFQKKIQALMETKIFRDTSKMFVTPLLPTLTKHILPYGTVLVRQGQQVRKIYFVAEGNLEVMLLDRAKRNIKHLNIEQKPKNFYVKKTDSRSLSKTKQQQSYSIHNTFYYPVSNDENKKEFLYGNKKLVGQEIQYNQHIVFSTLRIGDFFGGKSFLQEIERQKKMMNSEHFDTSLKANLSILSSSPKSIVYSIDEKKFFSLSDNFQKMIIEGIMQNKYFDEQNIDIKVQGQKQWKKYTEKLVQNVISSKKSNRSNSFKG